MQNLTNLKGPVYTLNFCAVEKESFISLPDYQFSPQHNMSRKDCSIITSSTLVRCEGGAGDRGNMPQLYCCGDS